MIILDTNVVSELMKPKPDANVLAWLDKQIPSSLYLTSISLSELLADVEIMLAGKRKAATAKPLACRSSIRGFDGEAILPSRLFDR